MLALETKLNFSSFWSSQSVIYKKTCSDGCCTGSLLFVPFLTKTSPVHSHISAVCSSCLNHIWDLWCTHHYFDLDSAKLLANALVSSLFYYYNSLLSGIAHTDLTKFQCVQKRLAQIVTKSTPFTCSVPLLCSLWLPVKWCSRSVC